MTIELAEINVVSKPWGCLETHHCNRHAKTGERVGEIWFNHVLNNESAELLLKILFTEQPLSIQVHPDDEFAKSIGLTRGKTEAWYILSAMPDAEVAIGLKVPLSKRDLRSAISDGSIVDLVQWHKAQVGDCFSVPAGTIHAIGAGIVLAEIQQRSDSTFRLFDYGRNRELHIELAVGASNPTPARAQMLPTRLDDDRILLTSNSQFSLEKIELQPNSSRWFKIKKESWMLVIEGKITFGEIEASVGISVCATDENVKIQTGNEGVTFLIGYAGSSRDTLSLTSSPREVPKKLILYQGGRA